MLFLRGVTFPRSCGTALFLHGRPMMAIPSILDNVNADTQHIAPMVPLDTGASKTRKNSGRTLPFHVLVSARLFGRAKREYGVKP